MAVALTPRAADRPTIISQRVLNLIAMLGLGHRLDPALQQPRIHHQWRPNQIRVEKPRPRTILDALKKFGHEILLKSHFGSLQVVGRSIYGKTFVGDRDPKTAGKAAGL